MLYELSLISLCYNFEVFCVLASSTFEKSPGLSILEFPDASRNISRQNSISRGRGRGKRKAGEALMEDALNASKSSILAGGWYSRLTVVLTLPFFAVEF